MGVKLKDIIQPEPIDFKDLKGRAISIDAFNTLYQFLSTIRQRDGRPLSDSNGNITSHLSGILYRNSSMIEKDIKPIYVFDGTPSYLKQETIDQRRQTRGEAQAAYLVENGDAWAVASQDYDCLLFGAKRVVRNLAINSNLGDLEYYNLKRVLDELDINREQLIDMGILIGTDFSEGLKGVGAKTALKLAKKGELENKLAKLQEESSHDISEVREIFLNHNVNTDYKIRWKKPAKNDIIDFLCEKHGFSQDRVSKACDKLKNLNSSQKSLEDWF